MVHDGTDTGQELPVTEQRVMQQQKLTPFFKVIPS